MRIFVAGITGVLGRALAPLLLQRGYQVRAVVRTPDKMQSLALAGIEALPGDLLSQDTIAQLPTMLHDCSAVIHIATAIPRDPTTAAAARAWDVTARLRTDGTHSLLQAVLSVGAERYIQQSAVMAYPDSGDRWIDEQVPLDTSPAREAIVGPIITMEGMLRATAADRLHWCILRAGTFVGPGTGQDLFIANLRSGRMSIPCDGNNYLSLINIHDMATAIVQALATAPASSTFNIVDAPLRNANYVDHLADILGIPHPPRIPTHPCPPSYRCTNQAAISTLQWSPQYGIWPSTLQMTR